MKIAFIKSNTHWGGPWLSFKYGTKTIDEVLLNSYGKAGHPIPMIFLFKMDVFIVNNDDLVNKDIENYNNKQPSIYFDILKKYMKSVYRLNDIEFEKYDIIYTEDEIIPESIVKKYKNTKFIHNATEHSFNIKYYDNIINHKIISFPTCTETFSKYINNNRNNVYIEYRTGYNANNLNIFRQKCNLPIIYNDNMIKGINPWYVEPPENSYNYWKNLGNSKYYVQLSNGLQGKRLGQAFVNSACMKLINIGDCINNSNYNFIHPFCRCINVNKSIDIIHKIENDNNLYNDIINYQNNIMNYCNKLFENILKITYLDLKPTWSNELFKSGGDEDNFIINYFNNKKKGYLLDISCACPISGSLSFKLINYLNWNGCLVEPQSFFKEKIIKFYKDNNGIDYYKGCINNSVKEIIIYIPNNDIQKGLTSTNINNFFKRNVNSNFKEEKVNCISINNLLEKYNCPKDIDFLKLDIEGSEDEVIKYINYEKYKIKLMCIEGGLKYKNYLFNKGYKICDTRGYNIVHGNVFYELIN